MSYAYPQQDLERPAELAALLGSFWSGTYAGSGAVEHFAASRAQLEWQTDQDRQEAEAALDRAQLPVWHCDLWYQLVLRESQLNPPEFSIPDYGDPYVYGPQPPTDIVLRYGEPAETGLFAWVAPADLRGAPLICNRTDAPTLSWLDGLDYVLADGYLQFRENPFARSDVAVRTLYDATGAVQDRELALWLFRAQRDRNYVWNHLGYLFSPPAPATPGYKALFNRLGDGAVLGNQLTNVAEFLATLADAPLATGPETVQYVLRDASHLLVLTDQRAYRAARAAAPLVAAGERLAAGTNLTDALQITTLDQLPDWLPAYTLEEPFLGSQYPGGLTFWNQDLPLTTTETPAGLAAEFSLGGQADVVARFWAEVHRRGVAAGQTLAQLWDARPAALRTTPPPAGALPATVNPLRFLAENVFRGNAVIAAFKPRAFGAQALPWETLRYLRRLTSPYETVLIIIRLAATEDPPDYAAHALAPFTSLTRLSDMPRSPHDAHLAPPAYVDGRCG